MTVNKKDLLERLFKFAIAIIKMASKLPKVPAGYEIASQIIRSGTSIGANCEEAQGAASRKDFLNKINVSLKEARETYYWLRIIRAVGLTNSEELEGLLIEANEIVAILTSSVRTTKKTL